MASKAQLIVRVFSARGSSTIEFRTSGKYVSFTTAGLQETLQRQPIQPTATLDGFWLSVLALVTAEITALE